MDNDYFDQMVDKVYPQDLYLNKAHASDTKAPVSGFDISLSVHKWYNLYQRLCKAGYLDFDVVLFSINFEWWRH